jgi:hypothetical protein
MKNKNMVISNILYTVLILYISFSAYGTVNSENYAEEVENMSVDGADVTGLVNLFVGGFNGTVKLISEVLLTLFCVVVSLALAILIRKFVLRVKEEYNNAKKTDFIICGLTTITIIINCALCGVSNIVFLIIVMLPIFLFFHTIVLLHLKNMKNDNE